ncbi:MAG: terminase large subunit, partial [Patescibacteria group bacterium]|nr:terminase large subunit [Patescibacteria group bacterium]
EAQNSPAKENAFKRYRLNIWTEQDIRWLSMLKWDACAGPVDPAALSGRECYAGLDLATTTDIAALILLFPEDDDGYSILPFFWVPEDNIQTRERRDRVPYPLWARQGLIEATPGNVVDYDRIRTKINELSQVYHIRELAVDRWNATQITTQLMGDGIEMVPYGQGFASMSAPTKELEKLVLGGRIAHGGHPVLRWMAGNVSVEQDAAGNLKPSKKKSTERIDGIVATVMALGRAMLRPESGSVYESHGIQFI